MTIGISFALDLSITSCNKEDGTGFKLHILGEFSDFTALSTQIMIVLTIYTNDK